MDSQMVLSETRIQILAILAGILLFGLVFELVRREKIQTNYSVIWFFVSILFLVFSVWRGLLTRLSILVGIYYAPSVLFIILIGIIFLLLLSYSVAVSELSKRIRILSQEMVLLKKEMETKGKKSES